MKILQILKKIGEYIFGVLNSLYEKLPLAKINEFLQKKSINIDLQSEKFKKILFGVLLFLILLFIFTSGDTDEYSSDHVSFSECSCTFKEMKEESHPHVWTREQFDSAAGDGYFNVVKYLIKERDGHFMDSEWTEAYDFALQSGYLEIAKYLKKKGGKQIKMRKRDWLMLVGLHCDINGDCRTLEYILEEGKEFFGTKPFYMDARNNIVSKDDIGSHEFNLVAKAIRSLCKLKVVLATGYELSDDIINYAIGYYDADIGTNIGNETESYKANRKLMQAKYYKIFDLLLDKGAEVNQDAVNRLCNNNRIKNKLEILYLFRKYGHKTDLSEIDLEKIYTPEQIMENKDRILLENQNAREKVLKRWEEKNYVYKPTVTPQ
ncbi:MAG: hypothetical protein IJW33_03250 [Lentisphaeria bacterium]|nr:hypothetical protein [Lentisphaeria bacterium]